MIKNPFFLLLVSCLLASLVSACLAGERDGSIAEVYVYRERVDETFRYTYVVYNRGEAHITGLEVGYNYYTGDPSLQRDLPGAMAAPAGWAARIVTMEENDAHSVQWESIDSSIPPGQIKSGFIIETKLPADELLQTYWTVTVDGPIVSASDRVIHIEGPAPHDTVPPRLTVKASPSHLWPPNGKAIGITVDIEVHDDTDPNPRVELVSVVCNECTSNDVVGAEVGTDDRHFEVSAKRLGQSKPGRVYVATYRAQDSAGNSVTAHAEITVPHDERK